MEFLWTNWLIGFLWGSTWCLKFFGALCAMFALLLVVALFFGLLSGLLNLLGLSKIKEKDAN